MEGLSERAYADHSKLSRGAVQKARKTGRLVLFADGSINAAASNARRVAMTDPDQQMRSRGGFGGGGGSNADTGSSGVSGPGDSTSYLKARTALTVYQAQEHQLAIQKKKGTLVDRARAKALVFRLARQERDIWVTWPTRVAALMAAQISAEMGKASGAPVTIKTAILQRVLETHVREQLTALADLRVSLGGG
jgi:phage terminase Nu1 subunit (DNA packaging protein)